MRIALDVDGVLANFAQGFIDRGREMGFCDQLPCCWRHVPNWDFGLPTKTKQSIWEAINSDHAFWLSLPIVPSSRPPIPLCPIAYVTSRRIPSAVTARWLYTNGFPVAEVITVSAPEEKVAQLQLLEVDLFVDDYAPTVKQCRAAGINTLLFGASWQATEDTTGLPTINSLGEIT